MPPKENFFFSMRDRRDETVDRIRAVRSTRYRYIRNFYPNLPYTQPNAYKKFNYPVLTLMRLMHREGTLSKEQDIFMSDIRPVEELYDLVKDPFELNNLAADSGSVAIKNKMSSTLDDWLQKYDVAVYPEDEREIEYAKILMKTNFEKWMQQKGLDPGISDEDFLKWWYHKLSL